MSTRQVLLNTIMLEPKRWSSFKSVTVPLVRLLPYIKELGFNELEVWGYHIWDMNERKISSLIEELKLRNMVVSSIASYLTEQGGSEREEILNIAKRYFYLCKKFESKRLRVFYGSRDFEESSQDYLQFIDKVFEEIFKMGQDRDIIVMPEMHEKTVIGSIEGLKRVIGKWKTYPNFGVVYQPYEFKTEPALKALDVALGHIQSVHLQNRRDGRFVALAKGDVDYRQILRKLTTSGYNGPFVLEFTAGITSSFIENFDYRQVLNSAARDRNWLELIWKEVCDEQT